MPSLTDPDPGPSPGHITEADKDRTSIKLMDLPMQPNKNKNNNNKDTDSDSDSDTNTNTNTDTDNVTGTTSTFTTTSATKNATSKSLPPTSLKSQSQSQSQSQLKSNPESTDLSISSSRSKTRSRSNSTSNNTTTTTNNNNNSNNNKSIESDSDPTFLPADNDCSNNNKPSSKEEEDLVKPQYRVGNPPHYETREERQIRIRKQFSQLDSKRSGFLDANSLVTFFEDITPDKNVQRRYADELLQLCHSRSLRRKNNSSNSNNDSEDEEKEGEEESLDGSFDSTGSSNGNGRGNGNGTGTGDHNSQDQDGSYPYDNDNLIDNNHSHPTNKTFGGHGGQVRYVDFEVFVEEKEERLWNLFREIDHNNDNEIQADELQASLAKAGINMTDAELRLFIKAMDKDGDGAIDFEEWRDFLVLLPREPTLKEIYNYVQEVVAQVGVDGDVVMPPSENDYVARYLLAGAIAGAVSRTATAPLDRLKVYLITNSVPALTGPAAQAGLKHISKFTSPKPMTVAPVKQRLLWNAIIDLYHQGGIRTFFKGNGLNIIKIVPESAIKFYTYETSKSFIVNHIPAMTVHSHHDPNSSGTRTHTAPHRPEIATSGRFLAGGVAGVVSQFSIYPLETIKTRIMSSTVRTSGSGPASSSSSSSSSSSTASATSTFVKKKGILSSSSPSPSFATASGSISSLSTATASAMAPRKPSIRSVAVEMWQRAGLRGFYRGLGPSLVGIFPYAAIDLSVFETLKFGYMRWKAGVHEGDEGSDEKSLERPSVFVLLACGTISGSVGATCVYPLSLARTRLQAQGTPQHPQTYTSTLDVFRKTYEKDGIRGFYKGMVPTLTKVVPAVSIS
ncbi:hypothetical protein BX616_004700, partial [Lobosporangium transversale]